MLAEMSEQASDQATGPTSIFLSMPDGTSLFVRRWLPSAAPRAVVQIAHGLAEHSGRYSRLAEALNRAGYAVYANDHRGHGQTARIPDDLGFFADRDGWQKCVDDLWQVNQHIATEHPEIPIILLGHSMGSFLTQHFICEHGDAISAAVLAGTTDRPLPGAALVKMLAHLEKIRVGGRGKSRIVELLTIEAFNKQFKPARTPSDWLSRDSAEVDKYLADPLCGPVRPSVQLALDTLKGMAEMSDPQFRGRIPKRLPIYIIAGARDPVSANGEGVGRLLAAYREARLECIAYRFYTDARHELFNEINRDEVTTELIGWLDDVIQHAGEICAAKP